MGNTCSNEGKSRAFTLDELVDLKIGQIKEMGKGCGPSITGLQGGSNYARLVSRGFGFPDNGEFAYGGLGSSCAMCSDPAAGYGCDNCSGASTVGGSRGTVKRIAYTADPTACCKSVGSKTINGRSCDPKYRNYTETYCDDPMLSYCSQNNWGKDECRSWTQAAITTGSGRTTPNVQISNYCSTGNNFTKKECQEWCSSVRDKPDMKRACDGVVINYCNNNPTDPQCTCMNPPENITKIQNMISSPKVCWYKPCQILNNNNYITFPMSEEKKDCKSVVCLIDTGDIIIDGKNNKVKFENKCGIDLLKPEYRDKESESEDEYEYEYPLEDESTSYDKWFIVGGIGIGVVLIVLILVCLIVFLMSG